MLKLEYKKLHKVTSGETVEKIAKTYRLPVRAIVKENDLKSEVWSGQVLILPSPQGDLYTVQAGDSKALLCGSKENYEKKNGKILYPTLKVWL
ncbi:MAG: LysM peptidoglycan-binding domain-containing protein [Clostridiales bacterium]|nr:LysM peptidoglycan-binding domain-containing protein [Clostridiales bacterium]